MRYGVPAGLLAAALGLVAALTPAPTSAAVTPHTPVTPAVPAAAPAAFAHPGVLNSRAQLDFVRTKVQAGQQPWKAAFDAMLSSRYGSLSRTPKPREIVECGSYSHPNLGCTDEREDAIAAYTDALAWYITGDVRYAKKSIELMDAWSARIKDHTSSNAPLQSGWAAPPGRAPPRSSSTPTAAAGRTRGASPRCCARSTCPR